MNQRQQKNDGGGRQQASIVDPSPTSIFRRRRPSNSSRSTSFIMRHGACIIVGALIAVQFLMANNSSYQFLDDTADWLNDYSAVQQLRNVTAKHSLLCMVPLYSWNNATIQRYHEIMRTWGKGCNEIQFLVNEQEIHPEGKDLPTNVATVKATSFLSSSSSTIDTSARNQQYQSSRRELLLDGIHWIGQQNEGQRSLSIDADWYLWVEPDTYLFSHNIRRYLDGHSWFPEEDHYAGHELIAKNGLSFIASHLILFSSFTMNEMVHTLTVNNTHNSDNCVSTVSAYLRQDQALADCLQNRLNISAQSTRDELGRERVLLFDVNYLLKMSRGDWWYWNQKPDTVGSGESCCSVQPWAFHGQSNRLPGALDFWEHVLINASHPAPTPPKMMMSDSLTLSYLGQVVKQFRVSEP